MVIRALLWDFGDTLADERWMRAPLAGAPGWPGLYRARMGAGALARRWDLGEISAPEVAAELGRELGTPAAAVLAHMQACCRNVTFFAAVMDVVRRCALPQAIVTVNCDLFSEVVVPAHGLADRFTPIVASWREGTVNKADLCDAARSRLGDLAREECLLIDNKAANIAAWAARGGAGYRFRLADRLAPGFAAGLGF